MSRLQTSVTGMSLILIAVPIWGLVLWTTVTSTGFGAGPARFVVPPFVLCGLMLAVHRLLRPSKNALPLPMFIAGAGAMVCLVLFRAVTA